MYAQSIIQHNVSEEIAPVSKPQKGFIFRDMQELPMGYYALTITKGDAWLFHNNEDTVLHTNETLIIRADEAPAKIRSLYNVGVVTFTISEIN